MEEIDLKGLVSRFKRGGFQPGERVILGHFGTVQTLLSLIFLEPVRVQLEDQKIEEGVYPYCPGVIEFGGSCLKRSISLMAGEEVVGTATSYIPEEDNEESLISQLLHSGLGLGQIVFESGIPNKRILHEVHRNAESFGRCYTICGPRMRIVINESFPRKPFEDIDWLEIDWLEKQ